MLPLQELTNQHISKFMAAPEALVARAGISIATS